ncbi:MAG: LamG-like jellyroll fold domain-containing protein [Nanoarchaeota archaeon]
MNEKIIAASKEIERLTHERDSTITTLEKYEHENYVGVLTDAEYFHRVIELTGGISEQQYIAGLNKAIGKKQEELEKLRKKYEGHDERKAVAAIGAMLFVLFVVVMWLPSGPTGYAVLDANTTVNAVPNITLVDEARLNISDILPDVDPAGVTVEMTRMPQVRLGYSDGILTFTSTGFPGQYTVRLTISDSETSITTDWFTITVLKDTAPTISGAPMHGPVEFGKPVTWTQTITAENTLLERIDKRIPVRLPRGYETLLIQDQDTGSSIDTFEITDVTADAVALDVRDEVGAGEEKTYTFTYTTPGPEKVEESIDRFTKRVRVSSVYNYSNVTVSADIGGYPAEAVRVWWMSDAGRALMDAALIDLDVDGLVDRAEWQVPHFSEQEFLVEITILNVQSYPAVGGTWTVRFNTTGVGDLAVRVINGTSWDDENDDFDLTFAQLQCGEDIIDASFITLTGQTSYVLVPNYTCNSTGGEISGVNTPGKHHLEFEFGGQKAWANNDASVITLLSPGNRTITSNQYVNFSCYVSDGDGIANITLYTNASGTWKANETEYPYGINLLAPNGDFEEGLGVMNTRNETMWNCVTGTCTRNTTSYVEGSSSMTIAGSNAYLRRYFDPPFDATGGVANTSQIEAGKTYTLSYWLKTDLTGGSMNVAYLGGITTAEYGVNPAIGLSISGSSAWTFYNITFTITAVGAQPQIRLPWPSGTSGGYVIDAVQLTQGTAPRAFTDDRYGYIGIEMDNGCTVPGACYTARTGANITYTLNNFTRISPSGSFYDQDFEHCQDTSRCQMNFTIQNVTYDGQYRMMVFGRDLNLTAGGIEFSDDGTTWNDYFEATGYALRYLKNITITGGKSDTMHFRKYAVDSGHHGWLDRIILVPITLTNYTANFSSINLSDGAFEWACRLIDNTSVTTFAAQNYTLFIGNVAPDQPIPNITGIGGTNNTNEDINCSAIITDPNANTTDVTVRWYNNSEFVLVEYFNNSYVNGTLFNATLGAGNTTRGDTWTCEMRLYDGNLHSGWGNSSTIAIANSAPDTQTPNISSVDGSNMSSADLNCSSIIGDLDGDTLDVSVRWYNNSEFALVDYYNNSYVNGTLFNATLGAGNTSGKDRWNCEIRTGDGTETSAWANSSAISIIDTTPPIITFVSPSPGNASTVYARWTSLSATVVDASRTAAWFDWNRSLLGYWSMEYSNATGILDNSTHDVTAQFKNGLNASGLHTGLFGTALRFDGTNDYLNLTSLISARNVTYGGWFYFDDFSCPGDYCVPMQQATSGDVGYEMYTDTTGKLWCYDGALASPTAGVTISAGTWHHIMCWHNSTHFGLYVNGTLQGVTRASTANPVAEDLVVGGGVDQNSYWFNGSADEIIVFNRALGGDEILTLFNNSANALAHNFTSLDAGTYNYTAYAMDDSGNLKITDVRNVVVDPDCSVDGTELIITTYKTCSNSTMRPTNLTINSGGTLMLDGVNLTVTGNTTVKSGGVLDVRNSHDSVWYNGPVTVTGLNNYSGVTVHMNGTCDGCVWMNVTGTIDMTDTTFTNGDDAASQYLFRAQPGAIVNIRGSLIEQSGYADTTYGRGPLIQSDYANITNTTFGDNFYGLVLDGAMHAHIHNSSLSAGTGGVSIYLRYANWTTINTTDIQTTSMALNCYQSGNVSVMNSTMTATPGTDFLQQVYMNDCDDWNITDTNITMHDNPAVQTDNVYLENSDRSIWSRVNITHEITIDASSGIMLQTSHDALFLSSYVEGMTWNPISAVDSEGFTAVDTKIVTGDGGDSAIFVSNSALTFLNVTHSANTVITASGGVIINKHRLRFAVKDDQGDAVDSVSVTLYNKTAQSEYGLTSGSDGNTTWNNATQYIQTGTTAFTYYSNYSANATHAGYTTASTTFNHTTSGTRNITISATPALSSGPNITNDPKLFNDIACKAVVRDADSSTLYVNYSWYKNGAKQISGQQAATNNTLATVTLTANYTINGESWQCEITPYDTFGYGTSTNSSAVTVNNVVTCGDTISRAGSYIANASVSNYGGVGAICVKINVSDVNLDCKGYTFDGTDSSNSYGIYAYGTQSVWTRNVTVGNCSLNDWSIGLDYVYLNSGLIIDSNVTSGRSGGTSFFIAITNQTNITRVVSSGTTYGIRTSNTNNSMIRNSTATDITSLHIVSSENITLQGISASTGTTLVTVQSGENVSIIDSVFDSFTTTGIELDYTNRITMTNLTLTHPTGSSANGILFVGSGNNSVTNTTIRRIARAIDMNGFAALSLRADGNLIANNTFEDNQYGVYIGPTTSNTIVILNNITSNRIINSSEYGIYISMVNAANITNNTIWNNFLNNTNNSNVTDGTYNAWNTSNTTATNIIGGTKIIGNYWAWPNGSGYSQTCADLDNDDICDQAYTLAAQNVDYWPLTDPNRAPYMNGSRISPTTAYVSDKLLGYCNGTDLDNDNLTYYYSWYVDGVKNQTGSNNNASIRFFPGVEANVNNVTSNNLAAGQSWMLECIAYDGASNSSKMNSSSLAIQNSLPAVTNVHIEPDPAITTDTLRGYCTATDANSQNVTYNWAWYRNGTVYSTGREAGTASTVTIRPDGAGENTQIEFQVPGSDSHWDKVDEATADDDTTYVYTDQLSSTPNTTLDLYTLESPGISDGTISKIVVTARLYQYAIGDAYVKRRFSVRTSSTYYSTQANLIFGWRTASNTWNTDPAGGSWTWSAIETLQAGMELEVQGDDVLSAVAGLSQVYAIISYKTNVPNHTQGVEFNIANISNSLTSHNQLWVLECWAEDGIGNGTKVNSTALNISNSPPNTPTLIAPSNDNQTVHERRFDFDWSTTDLDSDPLTYNINITSNTGCAGDIHITGDTYSNYTPTVNLCTVDEDGGTNVYNWTVQACDPHDCSAWSESWNFTIEPYVSIAFLNNEINFGDLRLGEWNDTSDDDPPPFTLENQGNVLAEVINVTANASIWSSQPLGSEYWQIKADNSSEPDSFNWSNSTTNYVPISASNQSIIGSLLWNDTSDTVEIDINVSVPMQEPPGNKTAKVIIWFTQLT